MESKQPNIIFFLSDQQRWDTVGAYGQELPLTPNLDRMAAEGVLFKNAYTCQPVCGPARACLQTGRYASEVGCHTNNTVLPVGAPTLAGNLSEGGYEVGYIGKWHLASDGRGGGPGDFRTKAVPPERRGGYDDYWLASDVLEFTSHGYDGHMFDAAGNQRDFPEGRYRVDAQTDWVLEYLESRNGERPFFLFLSYIEPHHQNDRNCYEGPHGSKEKWADYQVPGDLEGTEGDWREHYPDYLGCIHSLDENLGRIRSKLRDLGMDEDTLLIYTSDHGSHFCTRNGEYKRSCHDASIHIPMIACGPGFRAGKELDNMVSLLDIPATILAAGDCEPLPGMRGRPLQNAIKRSPEWPDDVFLEISESQVGRAIRTARWTYSVSVPNSESLNGRASTYIEEFLYDNETDPHQKKNLVASPDHEDVRGEMKARLMTYLRETGEGDATIERARP